MDSPGRTEVSADLAERYRVLLDVGQTLTNTLSEQHLYRVIYQESSRVLETTGFYVSLYDEETDIATVVFYADEGREKDTAITYQGSDSQVIRTGEGQIVRDRSRVHATLFLGDEDSLSTRSAVAAPLRHQGKITGAISAQSYRTDAYTAEDLELLQAIADLAAVAIDNARHVAELERRRQESEMLEEIGRALTSSLDVGEILGKIADAVVESVRAKRATVWTVEDGTGTVTESRGEQELESGLNWKLQGRVEKGLSEDLAPQVMGVNEAGEALPVPLLRHLPDAPTVAAVPIASGGKLRGILTARIRKTGSAANEAVGTIVRLANHASVALENAWLHSHVRELSLTDPLTGLPNRRHLMVHFDRQIAAAHRGQRLAAVIFDLDEFKEYNDKFGHVVGDRILRTVGEIFLDETRAMNLAARYGGDEFVSVISDTDREGVFAHAHRIRNRIENDAYLADYDVTVSYGMAMFSEDMQDPEGLLEAADRALYQAKEGRRTDGPRVSL